MDTRTRRTHKPNTRYAGPDVAVLLDVDLTGSRAAPKREVFRLLQEHHMTRDLARREVWVYWPDNNRWYEAQVEEVNRQSKTLTLYYPEDEQQEEIAWAELVSEGHIGIRKSRPMEAPLRQGLEVPVDPDLQPVSTWVQPGEPGWSSDDDDGDLHTHADGGSDVSSSSLDSESSSDDDEDEDETMHGQDGSPAARKRARPDAAERERRRKKKKLEKVAARAQRRAGAVQQRQAQDVHGAAPHKSQGVSSLTAAPSELAQAEQFKSAVLGALLHAFPGQAQGAASQPQSGTYPGSGHGAGSNKVSTKAGGKAAQLQPSEQDIRRRARDQLAAALQVALEELQREGIQPQATQGTPADLGTAVETALYEAYDGLSKEYKTRFRSLIFNLKDPTNPELRARVLQGELTPGALVALSPAELASRQMSAARLKKAEEMAKAKFLDEEAAARFSTAAAAALKSQRVEVLQQVVGDKLLAARDAPAGAAEKALADASTRQASAGDSLSNTAAVTTTTAADGTEQLPSPEDVEGVDGLHSLTAPLLSAEHKRQEGSGATVKLPPTHLPVSTSPAAAEDGEPRTEHSPTEDVTGYDPETAHMTPPRANGDPGNKAPKALGLQSDYEDVGAVPFQEAPAPPPDLAPMIARPEEGSPAASIAPGDQVWAGMLVTPEHGCLCVQAVQLGGAAPLAALLTTATSTQGALPTLEVRGTLRVEKVEEFLEELRSRSRSRTVTVGLLRSLTHQSQQQHPGGSRSQPWDVANLEAAAHAAGMEPVADPGAVLSQLSAAYIHKRRSAVFHPSPGVEVYLIPPGRLAQRLLRTVRLMALPHQVHMLPGDVPAGELMLAAVHRRDWCPPPTAVPEVPQPLHPPTQLHIMEQLPTATSFHLHGMEVVQPLDGRSVHQFGPPTDSQVPHVTGPVPAAPAAAGGPDSGPPPHPPPPVAAASLSSLLAQLAPALQGSQAAQQSGSAAQPHPGPQTAAAPGNSALDTSTLSALAAALRSQAPQQHQQPPPPAPTLVPYPSQPVLQYEQSYPPQQGPPLHPYMPPSQAQGHIHHPPQPWPHPGYSVVHQAGPPPSPGAHAHPPPHHHPHPHPGSQGPYIPPGGPPGGWHPHPGAQPGFSPRRNPRFH